MTLTFLPYDSDWVAAIRAGGPDANGQPAERAVSNGIGNPCRHCLNTIPKDAPMLICAARPFPEPQPYAETGPIFLCAEDCAPYQGDTIPPVLTTSATYLVKGYGGDNRIRYGTGEIVARDRIKEACETRLSDASLAFVDVRSATNNCFLTRVTRG